MELIRKYRMFIVIGILLLLNLYTCVNNSQKRDEGSVKELEKQITNLNNELVFQERDRAKLKDSIKKENKKNEEKIFLLQNKNLSLQYKVEYLRERNKKDIKIVDFKTIQQLVDFSNKRYKTLENSVIDSSNAKVGIKTFKEVNKELLEKDFCKEEVVLKEEQLKVKDSVIVVKDLLINNERLQNKEAEKTISLQQQKQNLSEEINGNLKKQLKKEKTKSVITKFLVPLAFITGLLIK